MRDKKAGRRWSCCSPCSSQEQEGPQLMEPQGVQQVGRCWVGTAAGGRSQALCSAAGLLGQRAWGPGGLPSGVQMNRMSCLLHGLPNMVSKIRAELRGQQEPPGGQVEGEARPPAGGTSATELLPLGSLASCLLLPSCLLCLWGRGMFCRHTRTHTPTHTPLLWCLNTVAL